MPLSAADLQGLRAHYEELTDDTLWRIVHGNPDDYLPEALDVARVELAKRDLVDAPCPPPQQVEPDTNEQKVPASFAVIAILSLGNTALIATGPSFILVIGLGVTAIVDTVLAEAEPLLRGVGYGFDVLVAASFIILAVLSRRSRAAFIAGMVLYAIDTPLMLLVAPKGFLFHLIMLFFMFRYLQDEMQPRTAAPSL